MDRANESAWARPVQDHLIAAVAVGLFPMLDAGIALFGGLWQHPVTAVVALPAISAALSLGLCRLSRMSIRWTLGVVSGCATFCLIATGCAVLMGAIASFYSGF